MITVDQIMAKSLVNIEAGLSAIEAAKLMKTHKVGSVFVKKDNRIIWNRHGTRHYPESHRCRPSALLCVGRRHHE
jgi:CBS domain-containing protein